MCGYEHASSILSGIDLISTANKKPVDLCWLTADPKEGYFDNFYWYLSAEELPFDVTDLRVQPIKVRVVSPWFGELLTASAFFSVNIAPENADALLCDWAPSDELFSFPRRKAWYCCEPEVQFRGLGGGRWMELRKRLAPSEFLHHRHEDLRYRVPHVTHFESLEVNHAAHRRERAVAIVSNFGGPPWRRHPGLAYRNRFITSKYVDLYGRPGWKAYRRTLLSISAAPSNYVGEIPGDWPASAKRELLAQYKVAIALENMNEFNYFTEKLVEAARAGSIPIYHPDPLSKSTILEKAYWIDPADYGNDPRATINESLRRDPREAQEQHALWFSENEYLRGTSHSAVFARIGEILAS
jgi:hypothetical protein